VLTDVVVLVALKELAHIEVYVAATLSFSASLIVNFLLNKYWSFAVRSYTSQQIVMYSILVGINYLVGLALIDLATSNGASYIAGKLCALVLTTIWNYFLYKKVIFANKSVLHHSSEKDSSTNA